MKQSLIEEVIDGKTVYKCPCCEAVYDRLPLCFGNDRPDYYWSIPETERDNHSLTIDQINGITFERAKEIVWTILHE
jgi:hypothetical protein